ncbi:MAG: SRPBCC domain-containing protein, partial [Thermoanaerobaculia bacterium]
KAEAMSARTPEPGPGPGDAATVSVFVGVEPAVAFDVFTREIDLWWRQGPRFRIAGKRRGQLNFEPGIGGRLFETFEGGTGVHTVEVGRVTTWDPPFSLELEWRGVNFKPDEKTFVAVRFEPKRDGTLVTVRHRGWSALPAEHPVRHGLVGVAFSRMMGMWWGDLMTSLREHVQAISRPRD